MDTISSIIIAVDGPSGAGKSTVSRMIAEKHGLTYIDTGAMYRAVALKAMNEGIDVEDASQLGALAMRCEITFQKVGNANHTFLDNIDVSDKIREPEVTRLSSIVSSVPAVRDVLVSMQRKIGKKGGVIMDGRDVGTVVFPNAHCKFFIDASLDVRGRRRHLELQSKKGLRFEEASVLKDMAERDKADSTRTESPLVMAEDAIYIDTAEMSPSDVADIMERIIFSKVKNIERQV